MGKFFKFIDILKESILLEQTASYKIFFKKSLGHDAAPGITIYRNLSDEEAKNLSKFNGREFYITAKEKPSDVDDDLYTVNYLGLKNTTYQKIVRLSLVKDSKIDELEKKVKNSKIEDKEFSIRKTTVQDLTNILEKKPIDGMSNIRLISRSELSDAIDKLENKKTIEKTKDSRSGKQDQYKRSDEKEPEIASEFSKEDRAKAVGFFTDGIGKLISVIMDRHSKAQTLSNSKEEVAKAREERNSKVKELVDAIKAYSPSVKVHTTIIDYFLANKIPKNYASLLTFIKNSYSGKVATANPLKELSATGTGAAVSPGSGEGVATKYGFSGNREAKKRREKEIYINENSFIEAYKRLFKTDLK
jgi:hypothetical protein